MPSASSSCSASHLHRTREDRCCRDVAGIGCACVRKTCRHFFVLARGSSLKGFLSASVFDPLTLPMRKPPHRVAEGRAPEGAELARPHGRERREGEQHAREPEPGLLPLALLLDPPHQHELHQDHHRTRSYHEIQGLREGQRQRRARAARRKNRCFGRPLSEAILLILCLPSDNADESNKMFTPEYLQDDDALIHNTHNMHSLRRSLDPLTPPNEIRTYHQTNLLSHAIIYLTNACWPDAALHVHAKNSKVNQYPRPLYSTSLPRKAFCPSCSPDQKTVFTSLRRGLVPRRALLDGK